MGLAKYQLFMFLFHYTGLAAVSPPTALAPFAAAARTRDDAFATMLQAWKYCLRAFLEPFVFCLSPSGMSLLMFGDAADIVWTTLPAAAGVAALSVAFGGCFLGPAGLTVRVLAGAVIATAAGGARLLQLQRKAA